MTRLIERIFSAMDKNETDILNQIKSDYDSAIKDGSKDTVQLKYVKLPEQTVDITDKENGEHTVIKKSGSCMMMKSGNTDGMFSIPSGYNTYRNFLQLFSADNDDDFHTFTTKAFGLFDKLPTLTDVKSEDDNINARKEIGKVEEKAEKIKENLVKKEQKLSSDKITDTEAERLKADKDVLELELKKVENDKVGLESQLNRDPNSFNESLTKASKLRADLDKYKQIAQKKKEDDEQEKLEKQQNNRNNLGNEDKMKKNLNNDYVSKSRKFSKAGYSDEREKIVSLLLNLLEAKDNKHKSKVLSGLESISNDITDNKIKTMIKSMISELKKISINDSQYDQIISDTIDNMKSDGIVKLFSDKSLEAITRFYAYGDMSENPNRQGYQQYVNDRRDTRLRALRNAALGAGALYAGQQFVKNGGWDRLKNWWNGVNLNGNGAVNNEPTLSGGRITTGAVDPNANAGNAVTYVGDGTATVGTDEADWSLSNLYNWGRNKVGQGIDWMQNKLGLGNSQITTHRVLHTGNLVDENGNYIVQPGTMDHHQSSYYVGGQQNNVNPGATQQSVPVGQTQTTSDPNTTRDWNGNPTQAPQQGNIFEQPGGTRDSNPATSTPNVDNTPSIKKSVPVGQTHQVADNTSVNNQPRLETDDNALHQGDDWAGGDIDDTISNLT